MLYVSISLQNDTSSCHQFQEEGHFFLSPTQGLCCVPFSQRFFALSYVSHPVLMRMIPCLYAFEVDKYNTLNCAQ